MCVIGVWVEMGGRAGWIDVSAKKAYGDFPHFYLQSGQLVQAVKHAKQIMEKSAMKNSMPFAYESTVHTVVTLDRTSKADKLLISEHLTL